MQECAHLSKPNISARSYSTCLVAASSNKLTLSVLNFLESKIWSTKLRSSDMCSQLKHIVNVVDYITIVFSVLCVIAGQSSKWPGEVSPPLDTAFQPVSKIRCKSRHGFSIKLMFNNMFMDYNLAENITDHQGTHLHSRWNWTGEVKFINFNNA